MNPTYITWFFAGLFFLFGGTGLFTENTAWRQFWAGLSILSLGCFALSMVKDAIKTGQIRIQYSVIRHAEQPRFFWIVVTLIGTTGIIVLIGGLWFLFFKN